MKPDSSKDLAQTMITGVPGPSGQWIQQELSQPVSLSDGISLHNNVNNHVPVQTGDVYSMEFLQNPSLRIVPTLSGFTEKHDRRRALPHPGYENLKRLLGLTRMDSECASDITEFASARGSGTEIENGVYVENELSYNPKVGSCGHVPGVATTELFCNQATSGSSAPPITKSESSQSLKSSGFGTSNCSQTGKIKFLCSFGGRILPRPSDGKLRYVGGDTRIISIQKNISWEELMKKTLAICNQPHTFKYQLPGEDLDALISVSSDEDLLNMIEEYYGLEKLGGSQRLRIFLIPSTESDNSCPVDAATVQLSEPDYQYVVAVNGIVQGDSSAKENYYEQYVRDEASKVIPKVDCGNGIYAPPPTQLIAGHQNQVKFPNQSSPFPPVLVQQGDCKNDSRNTCKNKLPHGSDACPVLVSSAQSLPENPSGCINIGYFTPEINLMNLQSPHKRDDILPPSQSSELLSHHHGLSRDFVAPTLEQCDGSSQQYPFERKEPKERTVLSEKPNDEMGVLLGYTSTVTQNGIPHAFSDSKLQEHVKRLAYCSQEGISSFSSLNFLPAQLSSLSVSSALQESLGSLHQRTYPVSSQHHIRVHNGESTVATDLVDFPELPFDSNPVSKCGPMQRNINGTDTRYNGAKANLENYHSSLKNYMEKNSNFEMVNASDINNDLLCHEGKFPDKKLSETAVGSKKKLPDFKSAVLTNNGGDKPGEESEIFDMNVLASTTFITTLSERSQRNQFEYTSEAIKKAEPENNTLSSEVAGRISNSEKKSHGAETLSDLLPELSDGLVSQHSPIPAVVACPQDTFVKEPLLILSEELSPSSVVDDGGQLMSSHYSTFRQNPTKGAVFRREVSLIDEEFTNYSDQKVVTSGVGEFSSEKQKIEDVPVSRNIKESQQVLNANDVRSPSGDLYAENLLDLDTSGSEVITPTATEGVTFAPELGLEDVNPLDADKDNLITDAMIAELEADLYGLQIIKNADLEELRELGSGTYGTVYHGKWRGTDVAIKRIKRACFYGKSSQEERLIKDFWREAQILSNLHHPNVLAFYGVVPDGAGGTLATVTEFMTNGSLRNVLIKKDRSLDSYKKLLIAMDAAFGMEYLHSKNIVHFDLKCDNLLVSLRDPQRPICKVGDFGLSRIKRNTLVSGGVRGTLPWMAPELLNGSSNRVSEKVDVFSFGITMWEILTGEEPYANMHCGAIIGGILKNTLRPPMPEQCDPEWRKLMEQCWSADPDARPSFTEIRNRLRSMSAVLHAKGNGSSAGRANANIPVFRGVKLGAS
ncbi:serine/threonine-protein kinase pakA isoform X1 [Capsicum annuum]|nr:serine/threonine-protein kinase pakA isoform X1 [Capsicum annuum]